MYLLGNLPFFKIHVNLFMARNDSLCANPFSKWMLWGGAWGNYLSFEVFPFSNFANRYIWNSLGAQLVKNLPAMQKTWVWFLGQEDSLGKEMTTHSSILAWRIPWTEDPGRLQSMGSHRAGHDWAHTGTYGSDLPRRRPSDTPSKFVFIFLLLIFYLAALDFTAAGRIYFLDQG